MKMNLCSAVICLAVIFSWGAPGYARSQDTLPRRFVSESDEYHVKRTVPEGFSVVAENKALIFDTCWVKRRDLGGIWVKSWHPVAAVGALLQSDDRQCEVIYHFIIEGQFGRIRKSDLEFFRRAFLGAYWEQRWGHRSEILAILMAQLGRPDFRYEDYVTVTSGRQARQRFNADSVFVFEVPIKPQHWDGEVYTHCIPMYLSRKDRAYMGFIWLFTDEGYKHRQQYMDALEGNVAYLKGRWRKPDWIKRMEKAD